MRLPVQRLEDLSAAERARIQDRSAAAAPEVVRAAREILAQVRREGDAALIELTRRFDGVRLDELEVTPADIRRARPPADAQRAIRAMHQRVRDFHRRGAPAPFRFRTRDGAIVGRVVRPFERAGIYAPGGRAAYPTTVLMAAVPAKVAGVREVILCTPPDRRGRVHPAVLFAARFAGVDRVFRVGGAQAVAAMAYGTKTVPKADIVVGPGNAYVTAAKALVRGRTAIDFLAGPTEILIISDGSARPRWIALDMAAQAEHDPEARSIFVTTDPAQAEAVAAELEQLVPTQERAAIIEPSLRRYGKILVARTRAHAEAFANEYAPEHLVLATRRPRLDAVRNAGSVFVGPHSACAFGDYGAGPNHILPTMGEAARMAALSAWTFVKLVPFQRMDGRSARSASRFAVTLASLEGLTCHRRSMAERCDSERG